MADCTQHSMRTFILLGLCAGALAALLLSASTAHLVLPITSTRNAAPIKTALLQEAAPHRISRPYMVTAIAATRKSANPVPASPGISSGPSTLAVGLVAAVSTIMGAVVMKLWGQHTDQQSVSLLAAAGRRSMALHSVPMNCRIVPKDEPGYRYLGSTEIPFPVPRRELVDSIQQWASNELRELLEEKFFGFKLIVDYEDDRITEENAFSLTVRFIAPDGEYIVLEYCLDDEVVKTGRTIEGFVVEAKDREILDAEGNPDPRSITLVGTEGEVKGRYFMVRRKEGTMPDALRPMVAEFLKETAMALTRYYAFGSLFLDDAL